MKRLLLSLFILTTFVFATTINVPADYATIQEGIDAASDGDTVLVAAGTYVENVNLSGKSIVIIGDDQETTIINGAQNGRVITFDNPCNQGASSVLKGFTIKNGTWNGDGAGIYVYYGNLVMKDLIIRNNTTNPANGGGITIENSSNSSISNCIIEENESRPKGGGIYINNSTILISNTVIKNNDVYATSSGSGAVGAGICYNNSNVTLEYVEISNNHSQNAGGGFFGQNDGNFTINNSKQCVSCCR